jgi:hypothetical protein
MFWIASLTLQMGMHRPQVAFGVMFVQEIDAGILAFAAAERILGESEIAPRSNLSDVGAIPAMRRIV